MESSKAKDQPKSEQAKPEQAKFEQAKPEQANSEQVNSEQAKSEQATLVRRMAPNAVKLLGEAFLPGASLLMDGKVVHGGAHLLAGIVAKAVLGPVGLVLVIANSYSHSTTGKNLLKQFKRDAPAKAE